MLVGVALGLIIGLVAGSLVYHAYRQKRFLRAVIPTEKTPLLSSTHSQYRGNDDNNYVQIY